MSVWKAREYWDAPRAQDSSRIESSVAGLTAPLNVQCSRGCLSAVKLPDKPNADILVVGAWNGVLQGFYPEQSPFAVEHLIFEKNLDAPILQIETGNFVLGSAAGGFQMAVLHPDKVAMFYYGPSKSEGADVSSLFVLRSYNLKAYPFRMVSGSFGGIKGRQMLCISTMDGRFTLVDQETITETPVLEEFLWPGPFCYLPIGDSFVIASSTWTADCYTYSEFASKAGLSSSTTTQDIVMRKSWSYNCGEPLVDIRHFGGSNKAPILLLGERHIFCLEQNGTMRSIRRLASPASCLHMYLPVKDGVFNMIVATTSQTLYVYEDLIPKWITQLPSISVDVLVCKIAGTEGVIVTLSDDGRMTAWYLGTDPEVYEAKAAGVTRKFNDEEIKTEIGRLMEMIKHVESGDRNDPPGDGEGTKGVPAVSVSVGAFSEISWIFDGKSTGKVPGAMSQIVLVPQDGILSSVHVDVQVAEPFVANPVYSFVESLDRSFVIGFTVINDQKRTPGSLFGTIAVRFTDSRGVTSVQKELFRIPFGLAAQASALSKKGSLKLDFEVTPTRIKISDFFPDFGTQEDELGISFDFYGTGSATVLISKKQQSKTRIQSNDPCLVLAVCEEVQRRMAFVTAENTMICTSNFPIEDFQAALTGKSQLKKEYQKLISDLDLWTQQLFAVEKRFLARLKDRDADVVMKLEELLDATQDKIIWVVTECQGVQERLNEAKRNLAAQVSLMHWLIRLNNRKLSAAEGRILELVVNAHTEDSDDESWEKQTGDATKFYALNRLASENVSSSVMYQMDFSDPMTVLKRAYLSQLSHKKPENVVTKVDMKQ